MQNRLSVFALLAAAAAGCSALVDTSGLSGGDVSPGLTGADASAGPDAGGGDGSPSSDGGPFDDGGGGNDASDADGEGGSSGYPDPVVIVSGAGIAAPSGNAQQQHLVFVKPNDTYWFFTLSGTKDFAAFSSKDFKSWSSAHTLAMPVAHGSDGRNVGIAAMPNAAVVHAAIACFDGSGATHVHARATLPSDVIAFDAPRTVSSIGAPKTTVGGPATTILTAGGNIVVDALDLVSDGGTFNGAVWRFGSESGTSFSSQAPIQDEFYFPKSWINAQTLVPLTSGGLLWVAENAEAEPDPPNLAFGVYASGSWTGGAVFAVDATQNYNDWSVFRVSDTEMHAVRYAASVGFEHARFTGTTWQPGGTIPAMTPLVGGGLVLVGEGSTFSLYAIDVGAARTVKTVAWDGTKWASSWHDVTTKAAVRTFLGGMSTPGHKAVYWTQENSGALDVVGVSIP